MSIINFQEKKVSNSKQQEELKVVHLSHFVKLKQVVHVARFERIKLVNGLILKIHKLRAVAEDIVRNSEKISNDQNSLETTLDEILSLASDFVDLLLESEQETSLELLNIYGQYRQELDKKVYDIISI